MIKCPVCEELVPHTQSHFNLPGWSVDMVLAIYDTPGRDHIGWMIRFPDMDRPYCNECSDVFYKRTYDKQTQEKIPDTVEGLTCMGCHKPMVKGMYYCR